MKTQKQIQSFSAKDANFIIKEIRYKKKKIKKKYIYIMTCKNCLAVSAVWPTAISRKDETILCLSVEESTPSIASLLGPLFFLLTQTLSSLSLWVFFFHTQNAFFFFVLLFIYSSSDQTERETPRWVRK